MIKTLTMLRGHSGTGKGTRMSQILLFLQTKMNSVEVFHEYIGGNKRGRGSLMRRSYGTLFPEINTVFLGYWCKSRPGGQTFWQSMDGFVRNTFVKDDCVEQLTDIFKNFSIVADINKTAGTGVGEFMKHENIIRGFDLVFYHRYYHTSRENYVNRIVGRNGNDWGGKKKEFAGFVKASSEYKRYLEDINSIKHGDNYKLIDAETDYLEFGVEYLEFIGKSEWISEFKSWSKNNSTKRTLGFNNITIDNITCNRGAKL